MSEFRTANFALSEFTKSAKAEELGIDNTQLTASHVSSIANLIVHVLQPVRDKLGFPMTIVSGFRCDELNEEVGGTDNSQHKKGEAADIQCFVDGKFDIKRTRQMFMAMSEMDVDQLLYERNKKGSVWVHVSYKNPEENRNMIRDNYIVK